MANTLPFIIVALFSSYFCFGSTPQIYSINDLEILHKKNAYDEYLTHALDIRPIQRGPLWEQMTSEMADAFINAKINSKSYNERDFARIEQLMDWPLFNNNEFFIIRRMNYLKNYLEHCPGEQKEACLKKVVSSWDKSSAIILPSTVEMGVYLGEWHLQEYGDKAKNLWSFFKQATQNKYAPIYCLRDSVKRAVFEEIKNAQIKYKEIPEARIKLTEIASDQCYQAMIPFLKNATQTNNKNDSQLAFLVMDLKHLAKKDESDSYLISYLMNGPEVGETFNQAWNVLEGLGKNFERRMRLLQEIKNWEILPDALFDHFDTTRRNIVLSKVAKNFPEYLDYYARTCLDYYKGVKNFTRGNPTMYCFRLPELSMQSKLIDGRLLEEIKQLPIKRP